MFNDYFAEVRNYLNGVPNQDQEEMIQFYEEQAMDANWTVEEMVQKYGTPKQFARSLRLEYTMNLDDEQTSQASDVTPQAKGKNRSQMIWLIILGLLASPVLVFLALFLIPMILGILFTFVMMIFSIYAGVIGVLGAGLASIFAGFSLFSSSVPTAVFFGGLGLLLTGLVVIFGPIIWNITKWMFEMFIKFMKWLGRKLVSNHRGNQSKEV
ncbi:membrane protein [Weissella viridescens]|jgi:uncharacterized membrane protein|uniref:Membrane protein-like protein n=1 Tax=Weissella viridescens TaxID=1629 RepID=A0A0R2HCH4_WEIVI|nr:DUF1700 domain-containing protein [Weissella viridescens]KRN47149.1 membrane protein-like protein [Weissella viridescens]MBX4172131.1 DUF1700 domain-containing protein [Weissella viridescens]QOD85683.1 DUF1700 domain-containing protein [Weissella viridescens]WJI90797.1 DUF1700 domain-containing protein [Weissella viridescens]GEA94705.1 membrane protein [Weissella viridescens]